MSEPVAFVAPFHVESVVNSDRGSTYEKSVPVCRYGIADFGTNPSYYLEVVVDTIWWFHEDYVEGFTVCYQAFEEGILVP